MAKEGSPIINTELLDPVAPLLQKLLIGETLSGEELALLEAWKNRSAENKALFERLEDPAAVQEMLKTWHGIEKNRELNKQRAMNRISELVNTPAPAVHQVHFLRRRAFRYAAAVLLLLSAGAYFWAVNNQGIDQPGTDASVIIAPGREGAVLTLADGSKVVLDSMGNGVVANQSGVQVVLQNGQLAYDGSSKEIAFNTITTPKGRQFRLQLPDGSKVWLNAASAIKYPTTFTGKERLVELEGEAYFEVAKNAAMPFKVTARDATVEVLGTSFNVNAYRNESVIRTTLLDGAVRLKAYQQSQTLKPGQQAVAKPAREQLEVVNDADLDKVMAWKNGLFNFEDASLEEVMRQLERWYDIEVTYAKGIPPIRFGGEINRQNTLQDVLQILEKSNVHFRFEESRKLVVIP